MIPTVPGESELALLHGLVTDPKRLKAALDRITVHREAEEGKLTIKVAEAEAAIGKTKTEADAIRRAANDELVKAQKAREDADFMFADAQKQWGTMRDEARKLMAEATERYAEAEKQAREAGRQRQANIAEAERLARIAAEMETKRQNAARLAAAL